MVNLKCYSRMTIMHFFSQKARPKRRSFGRRHLQIFTPPCHAIRPCQRIYAVQLREYSFAARPGNNPDRIPRWARSPELKYYTQHVEHSSRSKSTLSVNTCFG